VIEDLLKNEFFLRYFPPVAGLVFVFVFISLGRWQLDRAAEKNALLEEYADDAPYTETTNYASLNEFDRIEVSGRYLAGRQVLIDNISIDSRFGYYVITPFQPARSRSLLLVNRGWIPKTGSGSDAPDLDVESSPAIVQGLVGHLPRVAIRPGEAFAIHEDWPRVALYPSLDEVAAELGEELLPVVLLLSPAADNGFVRRWQPNISGPMMNYSYAFQWFAMAVAVILILGWQLRKRSSDGREET